MTALERADAPLAPGAPAQRRAGSSGPRLAGVSRQHDVPHATHSGRVFICWRGKSAIGHRQVRCPAEESQVPIQGGHPEDAIGHAALTDLVVDAALPVSYTLLHPASADAASSQHASSVAVWNRADLLHS